MIKLTHEQVKSINKFMKATIKIDLQKEIKDFVNYFKLPNIEATTKEIFSQIVAEFKKEEISINLIANVVEKYDQELQDEQYLQELHEMYLNNELI